MVSSKSIENIPWHLIFILFLAGHYKDKVINILGVDPYNLKSQ